MLLAPAYEELRFARRRGIDPRDLEKDGRTLRGRHGRMSLMQDNKGYPTLDVEKGHKIPSHS